MNVSKTIKTAIERTHVPIEPGDSEEDNDLPLKNSEDAVIIVQRLEIERESVDRFVVTETIVLEWLGCLLRTPDSVALAKWHDRRVITLSHNSASWSLFAAPNDGK
jgi:hypothetical protein